MDDDLKTRMAPVNPNYTFSRLSFLPVVKRRGLNKHTIGLCCSVPPPDANLGIS